LPILSAFAQVRPERYGSVQLIELSRQRDPRPSFAIIVEPAWVPHSIAFCAIEWDHDDLHPYRSTIPTWITRRDEQRGNNADPSSGDI
jgi:hypothetical protein